MKLADLKVPIERAQKKYVALKSKYPSLHARIVLSTGYGQAEINASRLEILKKVPSIFAPSPNTRELHQLYLFHEEFARRNEHAQSEFIATIIEAVASRIQLLLDSVELVDSTTLELIFEELDFDLINQIKLDPLVDNHQTSGSKASIRVVLGSLRSLSTSGVDQNLDLQQAISRSSDGNSSGRSDDNPAHRILGDKVGQSSDPRKRDGKT